MPYEDILQNYFYYESKNVFPLNYNLFQHKEKEYDQLIKTRRGHSKDGNNYTNLFPIVLVKVKAKGLYLPEI